MIPERLSARTRTLIPGQIEVFGMGVSVECLIRDLSDTGVRLQVSESVPIPARFKLHVPKLQKTYTAILKWRHGPTIGAEFTTGSAIGSEDHSEEGSDHVRRLEAENRKLRQLLAAIRADPSQASTILDREAL